MARLDWTIVTLFLSLTVFVGFFYTKKSFNIKDYALGGRKFSTATLSATLIATWISGSSLSSFMQQIYVGGLSSIFSIMGWVLIFLVIAVFFIPRMGEFLGKLSIADAMGDLYGREVRIVTILCGFFCGVCAVSAQFKVVSNLVSYFMHTEENYALYLVSIIVILYSCYGGVRAVAITDVIQACSFAIFLPSVCLFIWNGLDSKDSLMDVVSNAPMFDLEYTFSWQNPNLLSSIALFLYFITPAFNPAIFQRVAIAKDLHQAQRAFFIAFACTLIITIFSCTIGILIWAKNPNLKTTELLGYFIESCSYPGMLGLTIIGILSMMMSTADSYINSSAVLISYDLPDSFKIKLTSNQQLTLSRICTFAIGVAAIAIASRYQKLLDIFITATSVYTVVSVTFIFAVFGFRTTPRCVFIGMIFGLTTMFIWMRYFEATTKINCFVPSFLANALGLVLSHYILRQPGGWVGIKDTKSYNAIMNERREFFRSYFSSFENFNFLLFCKNNAPSQSTYLYSSAIIIIATFIGMVTVEKHLIQEIYIVSFLEQSSLILATIFITYAVFLSSKIPSNKYISMFWVVSMFYSLIFSSTTLAILSDFSTASVLILLLNNIFLLSMIDWRINLPCTLITILMSLLFLNFATDINVIDFASVNSNVFYIFVTIIIIILAFIRPKQTQIDVFSSRNKELKEQLQVQTEELVEKILKPSMENSKFIQQMLTKIISLIDNLPTLCSKLKEATKDPQLTNIIKEIENNSDQINKVGHKILSSTESKYNNMKLDVKNFDFVESVKEAMQTIKTNYPYNSRIQFYLSPTLEELDLNGDKYYLTYLIKNLLIYAMRFTDAGLITIEITECSLSYDLEELGVKNIKAVKFTVTGSYKTTDHNISDVFELDLYEDPKLLKQFIGISVCKKIVNAHYGKIITKKQEDNIISIEVILPINVYAVRPKKFDANSELSDSRMLAKLFTILEEDIGSEEAARVIQKITTNSMGVN
ncbi:MAG: hypothetical protein K9G11_00660 [Rickettsiaceae bacterium]|nr:hypothetical protein [Rickettsiaceae bacterium]